MVCLFSLSACSLTFRKNTNSFPSKGHFLQFYLLFLLAVRVYECFFFLSSAIAWLCKNINALCFMLHECLRHARSWCICKLSSFTELISKHLISCFQLNALVYCIFSYSSTTCFEPYCAHHQEDLLYIHSIWFFMCHSSCVTVRCTGS